MRISPDSAGVNIHFPEVLLLIILKDIFLTIFGQNPEAQGPRFVPAGQYLDHIMPGPLLLES
jgi:hypothetical protein